MENRILHKGHILQAGKYKIDKVLGQGGFGITYLAEQCGLNRLVAIKEFFIKNLFVREESTITVDSTCYDHRDAILKFKEKFLKEARIIAKLNHPNIIHIYDVFEENGTAYYVMEYVDGESLDEVLKSGTLRESVAIDYIKQIADALDYIHKKNILHLDVKPSNIMIRSDGTAILIDFGISKGYAKDGEQTSTLPIGISAGFAPIEQYNQIGITNFSPQTDIYSLGATLYKLITGVTPPEPSELVNGKSLQIPQEISTSTKSAILAAMQVNKDKRPANIKTFISILEKKNNLSLRWGLVILFLILAIIGIYKVFEHSNGQKTDSIMKVDSVALDTLNTIADTVKMPNVSEEVKPQSTNEASELINKFLSTMQSEGSSVPYDLYSENEDVQEENSVSPGETGFSSTYKVKLTVNGEYLNKHGSTRIWTMTMSGAHYGANLLTISSGEINDEYKDNMKKELVETLKGKLVRQGGDDLSYEFSMYKNKYGYFLISFNWGSAMWMNVYASCSQETLNSCIIE